MRVESLLSTTYFGPVQWYQKLYRSDAVWLEACESFQKQTYRNRCIIATANGPQTLSVPIEHTATSPSMTNIRISNHGKWRTEHWNALQSAYGESPFFDYYADDLRPFFENHWDTLFQFNLAIIQKMCELLDIHPNIQLTTTYQPPTRERLSQTSMLLRSNDQQALSQTSMLSHSNDLQTINAPSNIDFRDAIRPKNPLPDNDFQPKPYYQVYQQKHGFLPNLSILDLLFNMGNEAIFYL